MTPLGKYISKFGIAQKFIAANAGLTPERLSGLCNDPNDLLYADDFYLIIRAIKADLDAACREIFKTEKLGSSRPTKDKDLTPFGKYISAFLRTKKDLSEEMGISQTRISKLSTDHNKRPYAYEIYLLALAIEKKPSDVYEELYGRKIKR